ncbi:MAG: UDP-N-acetylglucosamine 2-epimerase (non-hydrolyzing) [Gammaproteobacteria bacterium]|nr:UDP-N-acetylglucosamine 2-epimerase (non-hydrolyzing) [Gammaproteobacteria bacterium]
MTKIATILGARPQFVKAAPVSRALRQADVEEVLVHTGQHYDANMSSVFFEELDIPEPKHHLGIGSGSHGKQTGRMLEAIEQVLLDERPDWVLVYGDTNSTMAGVLAAAKLNIPVAHVEAGLRSFNRRMPEEQNRIVADHLATLLFAPTETAVAHLRHEGIAEGKIDLCGDVMFDAARMFAVRAESVSHVLEDFGLTAGGYCLATVHRAENTDVPDRLAAILDGLALLAAEREVVLPLHPRTRALLDDRRLAALSDVGVRIVDPLGYLDTVMLEKHAAVVATDSGGMQKEAFFYNVPCVTLRDETEWGELIELGWNRLCTPSSSEQVVAAIRAALGSKGRDGAPYGDGDAASKLVRRLLGVAA